MGECFSANEWPNPGPCVHDADFNAQSDDALWVALAVQNGAEIYGGDTVMPGTGGGKWNVVGAKTGWQTWSSQDEKCGGGLCK